MLKADFNRVQCSFLKCTDFELVTKQKKHRTSSCLHEHGASNLFLENKNKNKIKHFFEAKSTLLVQRSANHNAIITQSRNVIIIIHSKVLSLIWIECKQAQ